MLAWFGFGSVVGHARPTMNMTAPAICTTPSAAIRQFMAVSCRVFHCMKGPANGIMTVFFGPRSTLKSLPPPFDGVRLAAPAMTASPYETPNVTAPAMTRPVRGCDSSWAVLLTGVTGVIGSADALETNVMMTSAVARMRAARGNFCLDFVVVMRPRVRTRHARVPMTPKRSVNGSLPLPESGRVGA